MPTSQGIDLPLSLGIPNALDVRTIVPDVGYMTSNAAFGSVVYEGMIVYVTSSNQLYLSTDPTEWNDPELAGWELVGTQISIPPNGPLNSIQYKASTFGTSGSAALLFISSSNTLTLNGTMKVTGSLSQGSTNIVTGLQSHAEGFQNTTLGAWSHAEGFDTDAEGNYSHTEGTQTKAIGVGSHAEGFLTKTAGLASNSHAEGSSTIVTAPAAHAEGYFTSASANYSHAEGYTTRTKSGASYSHTEGAFTITEGVGSHAEGIYTSASGQFAHAEGSGSQALGEWSHAEGRNTIANNRGTHAEGVSTYAGFIDGTTVGSSANYAHAEGSNTRAVGFASHAEGVGTLATSEYAHAQGTYTTASGFSSFVGGGSTRATGEFSSVLGIKNKTGNALFVIGNGTDGYTPTGDDTNRSDLAVFWPDSVILSQSIYLPDVELSPSSTNRRYVIIDTTNGKLEYSATAPGGGGGGGDITDVNAGLGISVIGSTGPEPIVSLNTSSAHFELGVSASAASYGFGNVDVTNNINNNIITATGTNTLNGESNLSFNGSILRVTGSSIISSSIASQPALTIIKSGSVTTPITRFEGANGGLVEIYDRSSGSLFSVNGSNGTPIINVRSNGQTLIGSSIYQGTYDSVAIATFNGPTQSLLLPGYPKSLNMLMMDFVAISGSYGKVGTLIGIMSGSTVDSGDASSRTFGSGPIGVNNISFQVSMSGQYYTIIAKSNRNGWFVKGMVRGI